MKRRRWIRPALWGSVIALHAGALAGTAWVQWRADARRPAVLVTVAPAPPPPPPKTVAPVQRATQPARVPRAEPARRSAASRRELGRVARSPEAVRTSRAVRVAAAPSTRAIVTTVGAAAPATPVSGSVEPAAASTQGAPDTLADREAAPMPGCAPPAYPRSARRAGDQGLVLLRVHLDARGHVCAVELDRTCGHPGLDRAAREAVLRWCFAPRVRGGVPVSCELIQPVHFRLR